ncbi:MAG: terminase small subunit [Lysobacter sp.]
MSKAALAVLQPAHQRFADEYLIDFNATAAYQRAGYKAKGAAAMAAASRLLARPEVQAYLAKRKSELLAKVEVNQEEVLRRLAFMALGDIRTLFDGNGNLKPMSELTPEEASLIQGVEMFEEYAGRGEDREAIGMTKKLKLVSRLDAVKTLGTHFGMFARKLEHSGPGGGPIQQQHTAMGELLDLVDGSDTGPGAAASRR